VSLGRVAEGIITEWITMHSLHSIPPPSGVYRIQLIAKRRSGGYIYHRVAPAFNCPYFPKAPEGLQVSGMNGANTGGF